jgi:hypothetical protein
MTIEGIQKRNKFNTNEVLEWFKMNPRRKVRMCIPLCYMIPMLIMCPTLKIDILKNGIDI